MQTNTIWTYRSRRSSCNSHIQRCKGNIHCFRQCRFYYKNMESISIHRFCLLLSLKQSTQKPYSPQCFNNYLISNQPLSSDKIWILKISALFKTISTLDSSTIVLMDFNGLIQSLNSFIFLVNFIDFECIQRISFGNGFALSIALSELPNNQGKISNFLPPL